MSDDMGDDGHLDRILSEYVAEHVALDSLMTEHEHEPKHEPLAKLPELTREELTELAHALASRLRVLDMYRQVAPTMPERDRINERIGLCRSLSTAVLEAANHMR